MCVPAPLWRRIPTIAWSVLIFFVTVYTHGSCTRRLSYDLYQACWSSHAVRATHCQALCLPGISKHFCWAEKRERLLFSTLRLENRQQFKPSSCTVNSSFWRPMLHYFYSTVLFGMPLLMGEEQFVLHARAGMLFWRILSRPSCPALSQTFVPTMCLSTHLSLHILFCSDSSTFLLSHALCLCLSYLSRKEYVILCFPSIINFTHFTMPETFSMEGRKKKKGKRKRKNRRDRAGEEAGSGNGRQAGGRAGRGKTLCNFFCSIPACSLLTHLLGENSHSVLHWLHAFLPATC